MKKQIGGKPESKRHRGWVKRAAILVFGVPERERGRKMVKSNV